MKPVSIVEIKDYFSSKLDIPDEKVDFFLHALKRSLRNEFQNAQEALENKELDKLRKIVHTIKGSLLNSGLTPWAEYAQKIEIALKAGDEVDYHAMLLQLKEGLSLLLK